MIVCCGLHTLTPQLPYFLADFPDETHSEIGVPDNSSVPSIRIGGDGQGPSCNERPLLQEVHRCSLHREGYGEISGDIQGREIRWSLGPLPRQRTVMGQG